MIDEEMAGLQRRVREYLDTGRQEALAEIETSYEAVKHNIGLARTAAAASERGAKFEEMEKAADAYPRFAAAYALRASF